jgi:broad specificity phosphatase PhoE
MTSTKHDMVDSAFFAGLKGPVTFTIVRHGQSEANARRVIQGLKDFPLDDTGRAQARELGAWLEGRGVETILSSPLARAIETASILASSLGLPPPAARQELRELDTGSFSGMSLEEAKELFPEVYADFSRLSWSGVPDAEAADALYDRALEAWSLLRAEALGGKKRILCVSHGGFIQWLVRVTFGTRTWMPILPTGNCGLYELRVEPSLSFSGELGLPALHWEKMNWRAPGTAQTTSPVF